MDNPHGNICSNFVLLCIVGGLCNRWSYQIVSGPLGQLTASFFSVLQSISLGSRYVPWSSPSIFQLPMLTLSSWEDPYSLSLQKYLKRWYKSKTSKDTQRYLRRPIAALSLGKIAFMCPSIQHAFENLLRVNSLLFGVSQWVNQWWEELG